MKKNIVIIILSIIIVIGIIYFVLTGINKNEKLNKEKIATYSNVEVIEYLQDQGYKFENTELTSRYTTKYVYVSNENNEIVFQKFINPLIGTNYSWKNSNINDEWADIKSTYNNDSVEERRQYREYEKWLEYEGLTSKQLTDALDYYQNYGE